MHYLQYAVFSVPLSHNQISEDRGPSRLVQLKPIHILRHELTLLLSDHGGQMAINQIVPEYKEKFGRMLVVTQFGFPKLIRALEAMPDTVDVSFTCLYTHYNSGYHTLIVPPFQLVGKGPSRIAILKKAVPPRAGIYVHVCMYKHYIQCTWCLVSWFNYRGLLLYTKLEFTCLSGLWCFGCFVLYM